jgi:hypothetical protein
LISYRNANAFAASRHSPIGYPQKAAQPPGISILQAIEAIRKTYRAAPRDTLRLVFTPQGAAAMSSLEMIQTLFANYALGISGACIGEPC